MMRWMLSSFVDFLFPSQCEGCQKSFEPGGFLCGPCRAIFESAVQRPRCSLCAHPLAMVDFPCPWCMGKGYSNLDSIIALCTYGPVIEELVHHLKFSKRWMIGKTLGDRLADSAAVAALLQETDVLVPVPLHARRQVERGFNQSELIAQRLSQRFDLSLETRAAVRTRSTSPQTTLTRTLRMQNLRDAFDLIDAKHIRGRRVTLVDDVMTTGTTLNTLAGVIRAAGPLAINAVVFAVADARRHDFQTI